MSVATEDLVFMNCPGKKDKRLPPLPLGGPSTTGDVSTYRKGCELEPSNL